MSVRLQFAFQGGGARLALLLPVVQAIRDLESVDRAIKVTRVAGTSAGAIAAALVAAQADMKPLVTHLRDTATERPEALRKVFPSFRERLGVLEKLSLFWRLCVWSQPIASEAEFAEFLRTCLVRAGVKPDRSIGSLSPSCAIICSDIIDKNHVPVSADARLLQALVDSAALPFIFRTSGQKLDGGLIDNLPVGHLSSSIEADGQILAVAFDEEAYTKPSGGVLSLAASLLDAAMTSKTRSTKQLLGSNYVMSLSPDAGDGIIVNSFDIEGFIEFIASENAFDRRYNAAKEWIEKRVAEINEQNSRIILRPRVFRNPDATAAQLKSSFANIGKIADAYHQHENITIVRSSLDIIAHSLGDRSKNDLIRSTDVIRVDRGVLNVYVSKLFSSNSIDPLDVRYEVLDSDGAPIDYAVLDVPETGQSSTTCVIVFLRPIIAGEKGNEVTIIQEQAVPLSMEHLLNKGADYLCVAVTQSQRAEKVEIGLAAPSDFGQITLADGTRERIEELEIPVDSVVGTENLRHHPGQQTKRRIRGMPTPFAAYGWEASDLTRGELVGVVFRKQKPKSP